MAEGKTAHSEKAPKVSVLMPFYDDGNANTREYFALALDAILGQTLKDFEIVLVYSGHEDFVKGQAAKSKKIRLVKFEQKPNSGTLPLKEKIYGLVTSRNLCVENARGQYIAYADGDDISEKNRLQVQNDFLDSHPEVGVVGSCMALIDSDGKDAGRRDALESDEKIRRAMLQFNPVPQPTVMARLALVRQAGAYKAGELSEDFNLWVRLAKLTKFHNLQVPLVQYRVHSGGGVSKYKFPVYFASLRTKIYAAGALGMLPGPKDIAVNVAQFASLFFPEGVRRTVLERARSALVMGKSQKVA